MFQMKGPRAIPHPRLDLEVELWGSTDKTEMWVGSLLNLLALTTALWLMKRVFLFLGRRH